MILMCHVGKRREQERNNEEWILRRKHETEKKERNFKIYYTNMDVDLP